MRVRRPRRGDVPRRGARDGADRDGVGVTVRAGGAPSCSWRPRQRRRVRHGDARQPGRLWTGRGGRGGVPAVSADWRGRSGVQGRGLAFVSLPSPDAGFATMTRLLHGAGPRRGAPGVGARAHTPTVREAPAPGCARGVQPRGARAPPGVWRSKYFRLSAFAQSPSHPPSFSLPASLPPSHFLCLSRFSLDLSLIPRPRPRRLLSVSSFAARTSAPAHKRTRAAACGTDPPGGQRQQGQQQASRSSRLPLLSVPEGTWIPKQCLTLSQRIDLIDQPRTRPSSGRRNSTGRPASAGPDRPGTSPVPATRQPAPPGG